MKRILSVLLCFLLVFSLCACVPVPTTEPTESTSSAQIVNPVRSVDGPLDFTKYLGFYMPAPEDAENCHYSVIFAEIAQIQFTYEGTEYCLRGSMNDGDISGVYGPFEDLASGLSLDHPGGSCNVQIRYTTDGGALANWTLFSIHYSLFASQVADRDDFSQFVLKMISDKLDQHQENLQQQFIDMASDSPITITSCAETYIPYAIGVYSKFWDGKNMISADGGFRMDELTQTGILPTIPYGEDFTVTFTSDGELDIIILYDENLQRLDDQWDLDCFSELGPGTYYAEVVIFEYGEYIPEADETTYSGVSCVFKLKVE